MNSLPVIAIDGPSGSGKGSVSQALKRHLGWHLLDSGAIYRVLAFVAKKQNIALDDEEKLALLADRLTVSFEPSADGEPAFIIWEGNNISSEVRSESAGKNASLVAVFPKVRSALLSLQRRFLTPPGLVADGRDMGTVVFSDAPLKIFLTASSIERAKRRQKQLIAQGIDVKLRDLIDEVEARDRRDSERECAPLKPASDAVVIDTTEFSITEVVEKILSLVDEKLSIDR